MASTNDATVNAFYLAYYGRPADPAGLAYWSQALATSNGDFSSIISAFSTSTEATAHVGTGTATDQISNVYQQLFGHAPDAAGLAYWTNAISSGNMSLAEAAIQITQGAQTSDLAVSTLRQDAAAQFTATIAASGVAYDGDAGIAAARVMIAAVNASSSATDIQSLVSAGASLAQTAHDNPAVITALANGGDLNTLLSTSSGQSDPVALVQALASIGKAALTDSAGLTTLLKGGGVAGLLASLPAGTTIKDVAAAVDKGGLAAGTTVVTTPVASTPVDTPVVITPTIAFVGIDGKDLPTGTTLEANSIWYFIDIHGKPANSTNTFQVSSTGTGDWKTVSEDTPLDNGTYYVRYIVKDAAGNSGTSNTLKLVMDNTLTSPVMHLSVDSGAPDDLVTNNRDVEVTGLRPGAAWSYSFDGKTWTPGKANDAGLNVVTDNGADGLHTVHIRTLENVSGNSAFTSTNFQYTLDTTAPAQGLKLNTVTHTDDAHATVVFTYTGNMDLTREALFYRIDTPDWSSANNTIVDTVNKTVTLKNVDLSKGDANIFLEAADSANNTADLHVVIPGALLAPTVALYKDAGTSDSDNITNDGNIIISGLKTSPGSSWAYSLDDGKTWTTGGTPYETGTFDLYLQAFGNQKVLVHNIDAAGNVSENTSLTYTFDPYINAALSANGGATYGEVTLNSSNLDLHINLYNIHASALTTTYEISTTGADGIYTAWDATHALAEGTYYVRADVSDVAGNTQTTQPITVHIDNTAPAVPSVALSYDSGTQGDTITNNGSFIVSGLEQNGTFDYSLDGGSTWTVSSNLPYQGTGYVNLGEGEHTVIVRAYDAAGNVSAASAPLHYTVYLAPLEGLKLAHIEGGAAGSVETSEPVADVVFSYTGQFVSGDTLTYMIGDTEGTVSADNLDANSAVITVDTLHHTITLHDVDLTAANPYVGITSSNAAGPGINAGDYIGGPFSYYFMSELVAGINLGARIDGRHIYLTDGGKSVEIGETSATSYTSLGVQENAVKGVLGVGANIDTLTENSTAVYALGTNKGDTFSGSHVWGFDGDDTITAIGDSNDQAMIYGGAGADVIHTESASSFFGFTGASDSSIATDTGANSTIAAHGFDTVYIGGAQHTTQTFNFAEAAPAYFTSVLGADNGAVLTGAESGSALLTLINTATADAFSHHTGAQQAALIDFGMVGDSHVNYLVVDSNGDGHIGTDEYVVKVIGSAAVSELQGNGVILYTQGVA